LVVFIDLCGAWGDFGLGEFTHRVAQGIDIVTQLKV